MERMAHDLLENISFFYSLEWLCRQDVQKFSWFTSRDLISPMIFVLAAEALTQLLLKAQLIGEINGLQVSSRSEGISILQFANGTLVSVNGNMAEASTVKNILILFEACSG